MKTLILAAVIASMISTVAIAADPVVVLPLGDSITAGVDGGYRKLLMEKLAAFAPATTVGSQIDHSLPPGQQAHEGHPGWRLDQIADNLIGPNKDDPKGGYWLTGGHDTGREAIKPTAVLLMAGINDLNQMIDDKSGKSMSDRSDEILATLQTRLKRVVTTLTDTLPDSTIYLGGCIPYANGLLSDKQTGATPANRQLWATQDHVSSEQELGVNHWVLLFNRWLRDVYVPELQKAGKKVKFVDLYAPFILANGSVRGWSNQEPENSKGPAAYGDYGLHPNLFGYGLIAEAWAASVGPGR